MNRFIIFILLLVVRFQREAEGIRRKSGVPRPVRCSVRRLSGEAERHRSLYNRATSNYTTSARKITVANAPSVLPRKCRLRLNPDLDFWESDADGTADQANVRRG